MSEIQEEAYSEACDEIERLKGLLKKVDVSVEKLAYCKGLCGRAADALDRPETRAWRYQWVESLIAELRKAAQ